MRRRYNLLLAPMTAALALVGCTADSRAPDEEPAATPSPSALISELVVPTEPAVLATDEPVGLAADTSRTFFAAAPVVVLTAPETALRAASVAVALGVPLLLDEVDVGEATANDSTTADAPSDDAAAAVPEPGPVGPELDRLGTTTVLTVGDVTLPGSAEVDVVRAPRDDAALEELIGTDLAPRQVAAGDEVAALATLDPANPELLAPEGGQGGTAAGGVTSDDPTGGATSSAGSGSSAELPRTERPDPTPGKVLVLSTGDPSQVGAVANARSAGATVHTASSGDPRATAESVEAIAATAPEVVVGLGTAFGDAETLSWRATTAATGTQLPGGGQLVLPGKTYVALYGHPAGPALGVLGEQDAAGTIERAAAHAEPYRALTDTHVVPALEIIATVASAEAGDDGNYSAEKPVEQLRPLVDLAHENGQYVVLDLQPGRTDFLTQAKRYEELLSLPNVGLALDPEWRLLPDQVHLRQIGQVDVAEVNEVVTWLADLTRANNLPQKVLILHQFQVRMIPGVDEVDQSRSELAVVIHVDGQGAQRDKQVTWRTLRANAPSVAWWGWKNFYDEDLPMLTPEQTMAVEPRPAFISYQ